MRARFVFVTAMLAVLVVSSMSGQRQESRQKPEGVIKSTDSETLWRGKYEHCDYGFAVLLPKEFIAHSSVPPYPNHGFLVGLPDPTTVQSVSFEDPRFIYVSAMYNTSDARSLSHVVNYLVDLTGRHKTGFRITGRRTTKLDGLSAAQFRAEWSEPAGVTVEEVVVVLRSGIIYEIGLQTTSADYAGDNAIVQRIKRGFGFRTIRYC